MSKEKSGPRTSGPDGGATPGVPPVVPTVAEDEPGMISVDFTGLFYQFARSFVLIFPVYALGYLGLSFSWLLLALLLLGWWKKNRGGKASRWHRALAFLDHEEKAVRHAIASADLPAWG